ncbi:Molybdenum cofactor sulfurase [Striga hermonthica]|uniref:Molybdenum cofactor sulfurase n=1 Tax=Striga hermonthica TaxID=68872 RepID=A0A9N7MUM5_STRHE|nr:Molybdenum cofactor sulfurase [Striga hermonthica]
MSHAKPAAAQRLRDARCSRAAVARRPTIATLTARDSCDQRLDAQVNEEDGGENIILELFVWLPDLEKERFLQEFGEDYGYPNAPKTVDEIRATEFKRLNDTVYLDHGGATLYSEFQMEDVFKDLNSTLYGNPHSQSNCSLMTSDVVGDARQQASRYLSLAMCDTYNLFAFPSECNFSGLRFNLDLVNVVKEDSFEVPGTSLHPRWMILIDAAKGSATSPPDLSKYKADFVVVSFYKLFGYPTGIGALIARNEAAMLLKKTYFSGGTVAASVADIDFYRRRDGIEEHFEDGTLSFASIASLRHGFKILNALTMSGISRHEMSLASYVRRALLSLTHVNGNRVCTVYGIDDPQLSSNKMGPTVSFNLKRLDGSWIGHREVEKLASLSNIQLRTGCFCNPGACAKHLGLSHSDLLSNVEAGHICWDDQDILHGKPTGAVRVSFGYMSTFEDARRFLEFIRSSFVSLTAQGMCRTPHIAEGIERVTAKCSLKSITIYPIKSCAGFTVESWPLTSTGLLHDREWLLKSSSGEILTQKKVPELGFITTLVDLKSGLLIVESSRCKEKLHVELKPGQSIAGREVMEVYSQRYEVQGYSNEVDIWFSNAIGRSCKLVRSYSFPQNLVCYPSRNIEGMCRDFKTRLNFVNEAQFLLVTEESIADLNSRLKSKWQTGSNNHPPEIDQKRFRPNLVVSGGEPYAEDEWRNLKIGEINFSSIGGCNRCQMINMTFKSGAVQRSNEPLATLASYRRSKGKIHFGILLKLRDSVEPDAWLRVGQEIVANAD